MFQNILIGYDGPERGCEAIALAEALRDPRKGTLLLTSVYPPPAPTTDGFGARNELASETFERLALVRDGFREPARVQIRAVASDSPARAMAELAVAEHADLVVVGSSNRSALGRPLPGTTAGRLLHDAPCPVAVAPRGYGGGDIRRVGVAYDGSPAADAALHAAESLALEIRASLTVYCVGEPASAGARMIAAGAGANDEPHGLKPETLLVTGVPAEEIAGRAYGVIDLLFVGSRGCEELRRALLGNVSGAFVRKAGCPVVVTPRTAVAPRHSLERDLAGDLVR